jgi:putative transposase
MARFGYARVSTFDQHPEAQTDASGREHRSSRLPQAQRDQAVARWQLLRAHLEDGCPLVRVAGEHGAPERMLRRWLAS